MVLRDYVMESVHSEKEVTHFPGISMLTIEAITDFAQPGGTLVHIDAAWTTPDAQNQHQNVLLGSVCLIAAAGVVLDGRRRRQREQEDEAAKQRALDALFHADDLLDDEPEPLPEPWPETPQAHDKTITHERTAYDGVFSGLDDDLAADARLAVLDRPAVGRKMKVRRPILSSCSEPKPKMKSSVSEKPTKKRSCRWLIAAVLGIAGLALLWQGLAPSVGSHRTSASIAAPCEAAPQYETKKFKDIRKGDMVLARDEYGDEIGLRRVVEVYRSTSDHLRILEFESDGGTVQTLKTTDEHPFWDSQKSIYIAAKDLSPGDQVIGPDGEPSQLVSTVYEPRPEGMEVFNFQVEDAHTYYVKAHGIHAPPMLVHNACVPKRTVSLSAQRRTHILDGDATGGGHGPGRGIPGKSEFPSSMTDTQVIDTIIDVASDLRSQVSPGRRGRKIVRGSRNGLDIQAILEPDGSIVTGYPTNVPRIPRR